MWNVFKFELKYRSGRPATYLYWLILFLLSFFAVATEAVTIGGAAGQVKANAPATIATMMGILSALPGMLLISAIMGVPILRDFEHKTASMIFSTPIKKIDYLLGRFFGSYVVAVFVFTGILFGFIAGFGVSFLLGDAVSWITEPDKLLTFNLWSYIHPFLLICAVNIFVFGAIFFVGGALSKRMMIIYTQGAAMLVLYLIAVNFISDLDSKTISSLIDPFGLITMQVETQYWTIAEQNERLLPLSGGMLINRLFWFAIGALVLGLGVYFFKFRMAGNVSKRQKKKLEAQQLVGENTSNISQAIPAVTMHEGFGTRVKQLWRLAWFYFNWVRKQVPFIAIVLLGIAMFFLNGSNFDHMYGTPTQATTYSMLELLSGFNLFFLILVVFYSGELIWKERDVKINLIYDAMPYPNIVMLGGKFLAMMLIFVFLSLILLVCGIVLQVILGNNEILFSQYFTSLFLEGLSFLSLFTLLGFFIHVIVNHKFLGHGMIVVFFIVSIVMGTYGAHSMFQFANHGLGTISEMNGYGHYFLSFSWFNIYWFAFAVFLFIVAVLLSSRGAETLFKNRLKVGRYSMTKPLLTFGIASLVTFVASGAYIFYNTNVLNTYINSKDQEKLQSQYEKELKKYLKVPQPKIVDVNLEVDVYPESRDFKAKGRYILQNKNDEALTEIHIQTTPDGQLTHDINFSVETSLKEDFSDYNFQIFELKNPIAPGDSITMDFVTKFTTTGFVEGGSSTEILENGTFFNSMMFPLFGYSEDYEIGSKSLRKKYDLPEKDRMRHRDDPIGLSQHLIGDDADRYNFEIVLSTSNDQIAIAPGYLKRQWEEEGRSYFHYKMDKPILPFYSVVSARYDVVKDTWIGQDGHKVNLEIYHHPGHEYNVDRMMDGLKESLTYFTENFSPYQYDQMRIMEFPRYRSFAQSFANTVPFSEGIGFLAKVGEDDVDMPFYVTCHEVAHQWWAHQVTDANVQGNAMVSETMSQYSALMVMKKNYGEAEMREFLKHELDRYLSGRSSEINKEMPLELVEGQGYIHYRKGSLIMYALQDYISEDSVNIALRRVIDQHAYREDRYTTSEDFLKEFRKVTPDSLQYILTDMFENITLYENRTEKAEAKEVNGTYEVNLDIKSVKYVADSLGNEKAVPLNDWIDIGVLGKTSEDKDTILYMQKHKINQEDMSFSIFVDEKPIKAGIDPINKLIDRNSSDNTKNIELVEE